MKKSFIIAAILALHILSAFGREHPFLFMTPADMERVRENAQFNADFAKLAQSQIAIARRIKVDQLPPFENDWWKEEVLKPNLKRDRSVTLEYMRLIPLKYGLAAKDCARAWVLTGETNFLDKAKEILLKHSEYSFEFEDVNCGIDYIAASREAMEAYDIAYTHFTEPEREKMKDFFMRLLVAVKKNNEYWVENNPSGASMNNHEGSHRACMAMVGFFYDLPEYIDLAITGSKGFEDMLRRGFQDDGLWLEGSLPYGFVQLKQMLFMAEMSRNSGYPINLYEHAIDDGRSLRHCYDSFFELFFPDGLLPAAGDGYGGLHYYGGSREFERLYARLGDSKYAWLINREGKRGRDSLFWGVADLPISPPPAASSKLWLQSGYAALRTDEGTRYWDGNGWTLFANFSRNVCHNHADKLSIMLYARDHLWLRDSECRPSRVEKSTAKVNQQLNWTTPSHNTVLIDFKSQSRGLPVPLDIQEYVILPTAKRITMGDPTGLLYEGVRQLRTCIVRDDYVVDVFQIEADQPHDIAWTTHIDAQVHDCFASTFSPATLPASGPWKYIQGDDVSLPRNTFWETFSHEGIFFRMDVFSANPAQYTRCRYPLVEGEPSKEIPMRMVSCHSTHAVFVAVYRVDDESITSPVQFEINDTSEKDSWQLDITCGEKRFKHRIIRL